MSEWYSLPSWNPEDWEKQGGGYVYVGSPNGASDASGGNAWLIVLLLLGLVLFAKS